MNWAYFWLAIFGLFFINLAWRIRKLPPERRAKVAIRECLIILACYFGMFAMLLFLEGHLIFVPHVAKEAWQEPTWVTPEDVWLDVTVDGRPTRCHAWWVPTPTPAGTLLYCHGNAGNLSGRQEQVAKWKERGYQVLIFDYPGYGRSEGQPSEDSCIAAAATAYRWLIDRDIAANSIVLYGKSLGCAVATELATTHEHRALVLFSPFTSIPDMAQKLFPFFPARWFVRTQFDNRAKLRQYRGDLFLGHGEVDRLIPVEHGKTLFESCPSTRKKLVIYAGVDHGAPPPEFFDDVETFLAQASAKGATQ